MPQTNYRRTLVGDQSGVAVNIPIDTTDRMTQSEGDGVFAVVGQFSRGRIDKPFLVDKSQMYRKLGKPKSMRTSAANEAYVQTFEALRYGASGVVVARLASSSAKLKWLVVKHGADEVLSVADDKPQASDDSWIFAFQLLNAIDEGVYVSVAKGETEDEVSVVVRERAFNSKNADTDEGVILYEFSGSTNPDSVNEMGETNYLENVASMYYGDEIVFAFNSKNATIKSSDALNNKAQSGGFVYYTDSGSITAEDYRKYAEMLGKTTLQYRYILASGGSVPLTQALINIGIQYNRKVKVDVNGNLAPDAAVTWIGQFNYKAQDGMYVDWLWSPISRDDPTGASGNMVFGTAGIHIGYACARNMSLNGYGLPKLNQPIAGQKYMLSGTRIRQIYEPTDTELAALAKAHINPVLYVEYHNGSGFVWDDSLSGAKKTGISKLSAASEMSIWAQEQWGRFSRSLTQLPMSEAITKAQLFTEETCKAMLASGWLVESASLGAPYAYRIYPNERYPDDRLEIELDFAFDGVVRRVTVSQNMYSRS